MHSIIHKAGRIRDRTDGNPFDEEVLPTLKDS